VRIVVVDDDPMLVALLTDFLAEEGHVVRVVRSHAEASVACEAIDCDVFLVDGFGPLATQLTIEQRALLVALGARAPVILCSAHRWPREMTPDQIGVAAVLPKPFELGALLDLLAGLGRPSP
jgi:DNA-binding response OmpR family regulator